MIAKDQKQNGLALVIVLWVVASLALLVAAFNASVKSSAVMVASEAGFAKHHNLINAGVEFAAAQLKLVAKQHRWQADGTPYELKFAGETLRIKILDINGRIDINKSSDAVLLALLKRHTASITQAETLRDRILDWRDKDQKSREKGAEDLAYKRAKKPHGAGDEKFTTISQLRDVLGMDYQLYRKLLPLITIYTRNGLINPMTASRNVLLSMPNISEIEADQVIELRAQAANSKSAVLNLLAKNRKWLNTSSGPVYDISIEIRDANGKYGAASQLTILTGGDSDAPFRVLAWRR